MTINKNIKFKTPPLYKILLVVVILYYLVFGVLMAYTAGQPDQSVHYYFSKRFSETWGIPEEGDAFPSFIFTGQPYLYYWLNGLVAKIYQWIFPVNPPLRLIILLRLFSVFISMFTVFFAYKLGSKATGNEYAGVLTAFFLSNTLMFVFSSGGINYDILMNLAGMASLFYLVNIYKGENFIRNTALTGIWLVVGSLSKEQFLLLALIIFLAWFYFAVTKFKKIKLNFSKTNIFLIILLIGFISLFIGLFGGNYLRYSRLTPICSQIKTSEECGAFGQRMEYYEPYDFRARWFFRDNFPNAIEYAFQFWLYKMAQSIWGILSHNTFVPMFSVALHSVMALWGFMSLIRYWKPQDKIPTLLIYVLASYSIFILLMNYRNETNFSFQHFAVSGRYFSPIYGVIFSLMIYYYLKIRSMFLKRLTLALAIMLYFSGGFWMYISRYAEVFMHWRIYQ
jgi:4-amino-4-deoxy-L-arabinose transferase-like glycosyltransferase